MSEDIRSYFPLSSFRPFQEETLVKIDKALERSKFVLVEAPTGSGKSPLAVAFARKFQEQNSRTHILTVQKILQDQYHRDFPDFGCQKGKGAYTCLEDNNSCAEGICNRLPKDRKQILMAKCPYRRSIEANRSKPVVIHNFDGFYYQKCLSHQFESRPLLIIDEAHNIENKFVDFFSFTIRSNGFFRAKGEKFPIYEDVNQYNISLVRTERDRLSKALYDLTKDGDSELDKETYRTSVEMERLISKLDGFLNKCQTNEYIFDIIDRGDSNAITFRPVFAGEFIYDALFDGVEKVLMFSATILSKEMFCLNIGLDPDDVEYIKVPSTFPAINRPIIAKYAGSMSYRSIQETLPKMMDTLESIIRRSSDHRGIIHSTSERVAEYVRNNISKDLLHRLTFRKDFVTVNDMMAAHEKIPNSFIVASGLKEGIDLKNDLSRVQIILKVPYLDLSDKRTKRRMTLDKRWYGYCTALLFIQSVGRSVRSPEDKAITYILDSSFSTFYNMNKAFIPDYIREVLFL